MNVKYFTKGSNFFLLKEKYANLFPFFTPTPVQIFIASCKLRKGSQNILIFARNARRELQMAERAENLSNLCLKLSEMG